MEPKRTRTHDDTHTHCMCICVYIYVQSIVVLPVSCAKTLNPKPKPHRTDGTSLIIVDYRRETEHIQNRRSVALGSREDVPTPQKGQTDPLEHSRLGLVGTRHKSVGESGNRVSYQDLGHTILHGDCGLVIKR
jgi:hypothetical protein